MIQLLVRHTVKDFNEWKKVFDTHEGTRKAAGSRGGQLFRSLDFPNELVLLMAWDTVDNARAFVQSDDLRKTMEIAGVVGRPDIHFLGEGEQFPV
jgi:quinol monooxygenase YgiN